MKVTVKLFAVLKEISGRDEIVFELPGEMSCEEILLRLQAEFPTLDSILKLCWVAVNGKYADRAMDVSAGDEVAVLPPVSGG